MRTSTKTAQTAQQQEPVVSFMFGNQKKNTVNNQRDMNDMFIKNAYDIGGIKVAYLPLSEMVIDMSYQRKPQTKINKIAKEWDIQRCGLITVAYRDGQFMIVDGQNRYLAALQVGETCLPCQILKTQTVEEEADTYADQGVNVTSLNTFDKFKAEVRAKKAYALEIKKICDKYSIITTKTSASTAGALKGVDATKRIYNTYGAEALEWIFQIIKDCGWHNVKGGYGDTVLSVLCNVYLNHINELDLITQKLIKILEETTPDIITNKASCVYIGRGRKSALITFIEKCLTELKENIVFIS